jgi:hypothetical protein
MRGVSAALGFVLLSASSAACASIAPSPRGVASVDEFGGRLRGEDTACAREIAGLGPSDGKLGTLSGPVPGNGAELWIGDFIGAPSSEGAAHGELLAVRIDLRGDRHAAATWRASADGSLPSRIPIDPSAKWLTLQVVVHADDGTCVRGARDVALAPDQRVVGAGVSLAPRNAEAGLPPLVVIDGATPPTYAVRLRDLEQRVDELKEQIRRSYASPLARSTR